MNDQRGGGGGGEKGDCYYHPKEVFVGVCPLCLYERLLVLSAKQAGHTNKGNTNLRATIDNNNKPPIVVLPKFFALTSLFNRFESSHRHHHDHRKSQNYEDDDCSSTLSQDDSFISIQFENNGAGSWEKNKVSKVSLDHCNKPLNIKNNQIMDNNKGAKTVIVEHAKPRSSSLRWRKRIGHLFHVMRWKRSNVCHVGSKKMEGVKVRNGWIRTLTKRREPKNNKEA